MTYQIKASEEKSQPSVSVRTRSAVTDLPKVIGSVYGEIMGYLGQSGQHPAGPPYVAYFNMDMQDLDLEIGFPVAEALPGAGRVQPAEVPGGKQLSCIHTGPYNTIEHAYQALMQEVSEKGYNPTGAAYEFYLNDPGDTPEDKLMTKVVLPLR